MEVVEGKVRSAGTVGARGKGVSESVEQYDNVEPRASASSYVRSPMVTVRAERLLAGRCHLPFLLSRVTVFITRPFIFTICLARNCTHYTSGAGQYSHRCYSGAYLELPQSCALTTMAVITDLPAELLTRIFDLALPEQVILTFNEFKLGRRTRATYVEPVANPALPIQLVCSKFKSAIELVNTPSCVLQLNNVVSQDIDIWNMCTSLEHRAIFHSLKLRNYTRRPRTLDWSPTNQDVLDHMTRYQVFRATLLGEEYAARLRNGYEEVELVWMDVGAVIVEGRLDTWASADWQLGKAKSSRLTRDSIIARDLAEILW